jgi:hypothetical protein
MTVTALTLAAATAQAGEVYVEGRVLEVVPVYGARTVMVPPSDCPKASRPPDQAGLAALLRWDLTPGCGAVRRTEQTITGYRVRYEWDNRIYSRVMREAPGETVTLRLSVR